MMANEHDNGAYCVGICVGGFSDHQNGRGTPFSNTR